MAKFEAVAKFEILTAVVLEIESSGISLMKEQFILSD
jgi:hypothetical protein